MAEENQNETRRRIKAEDKAKILSEIKPSPFLACRRGRR